MAVPALAVEGLTFAHVRGGQRQVDDVTLTLPVGRTLGILGGNECGKTTLAQILLGNLKPASGQLLIHGERMRAMTPVWLLVARLLFVLSVVASIVLGQRQSASWATLLAVPLLLALLEAGNQCGLFKGIGAGEGASGYAPAGMRRRGVAYISSEHDAAQQLPAKATVEQAISQHMPLPAAAHAARRREVVAALRAAGFQMYSEGGQPTGSPEQYVADGLTVGELSGGQRQLVYILSVLASRPSLLICDEMLCGLDIDRQASVLHMLQALQVHFGLSILYMSVDLSAVQLMAHDAAFMCAAPCRSSALAQSPDSAMCLRPHHIGDVRTGVAVAFSRRARRGKSSSRPNSAKRACTSAKAARPRKRLAGEICATRS